ncbi:MAG: hypothetical protein C0470_10970 [Verminephrobacter sp.]|nr:hypothetical protein [Verminephrobacter sp.]
MSVDQKIARLKETVARKVAEAKAQKKATTSDRQLKLELWPDEVRGVPNAILRGALFGVGQERTIHKKRTLVAAVEGYEIRFKGETFNQTDLDVLEGMLHLAMPHPLGKRVEFTVHSFLKALGRGTSGKHHEEFKEQVMRLVTGGIEITDTKARVTFMGTLVSKAFREEDSGRYVVIFDKDMLNLYEAGYSHIDWNQRMALGKSTLAKWLHGFYATHAKPYPYKVETLHNLCGSADKSLRSFRQKLKKALDELICVRAIDGWIIDQDDLVTVQRTPSRSQQKHLNRMTKRA